MRGNLAERRLTQALARVLPPKQQLLALGYAGAQVARERVEAGYPAVPGAPEPEPSLVSYRPKKAVTSSIWESAQSASALASTSILAGVKDSLYSANPWPSQAARSE